MSSTGERIGLLLPNLTPTLGLVSARLRTIVTSRAFVEQAKLADKVAALRDVQILYLEDLREHLTLADKLWLMLWADCCRC